MSGRFASGYLLVSGMLWVYTVWLIYSRRRLVRQGTRTVGVITAVIKDDSGDATSYIPEFRFHDAQGRECTVRSQLGASRQYTYTVGQKVTVIFMPDHPQSAHIDDLVQLYAAPAVMAMAAAVSFVVALIGFGFLK